jgi:hypothetical protein
MPSGVMCAPPREPRSTLSAPASPEMKLDPGVASPPSAISGIPARSPPTQPPPAPAAPPPTGEASQPSPPPPPPPVTAILAVRAFSAAVLAVNAEVLAVTAASLPAPPPISPPIFLPIAVFPISAAIFAVAFVSENLSAISSRPLKYCCHIWRS